MNTQLEMLNDNPKYLDIYARINFKGLYNIYVMLDDLSEYTVSVDLLPDELEVLFSLYKKLFEDNPDFHLGIFSC